MRSNTALSLAEFCLWVNANPWAIAGIQRQAGNTLALSEELVVMMQYPYQTMPKSNSSKEAGSNSRQVLADALHQAETRFVEACGIYPVPTQLTNEKHVIPSSFHVQHRNPAFKPKVAPVVAFGTQNVAQVGNAVAITKEVESVIQDTFTLADVAVADDTVSDDLHVYLTPTDGAYSGTPELQHEIRPVTVRIDSSGGAGNWLAKISAPAYLFVKPTLYETQSDALKHEADTYVDIVDVWLTSIDPCVQGQYIIPKANAGVQQSETVAAFFLDEGNGYFTPEPVTCTAGVFSRTTLKYYPKWLEMTYLAGLRLSKGQVDKRVAAILSKLALATIVFDEEQHSIHDDDVYIRPFHTAKAKYYRVIQKWEQRSDNVGPQYSSAFSLSVDARLQALFRGLEPRRGVVEAYGDMLLYGWLKSQALARTHI